MENTHWKLKQDKEWPNLEPSILQTGLESKWIATWEWNPYNPPNSLSWIAFCPDLLLLSFLKASTFFRPWRWKLWTDFAKRLEIRLSTASLSLGVRSYLQLSNCYYFSKINLKLSSGYQDLNFVSRLLNFSAYSQQLYLSLISTNPILCK